MKRVLYVSLALVAAAFLRPLVAALESGDHLPWLLVVLFALLPDALEAVLRRLPSTQATLTPDPAFPDSELLSALLRELTSAASRASESPRPVRLRIRPLPASRGRLVLRLLPQHAEALLLPASPSLPTSISQRDWDKASSVPFAVSRTPMPAIYEVPAPEGLLLSFYPQTAPETAPLLQVQSPLRNGTWAHSPLVLFGLPLLGLFLAQGQLLVLAASIGLLAHGAVDAAGECGLPRRPSFLPGIACHFWRDRTPALLRLLLILSLTALGLGLLLQTSWLLHRTRACGVFLLAMALVSWLQRPKTSA